MDLLELADRCEKATGPDRELDEAIHTARYPDHPQNKALREYHSGYRETVEVPRYTASLDAAMTLVPEGATVEVNIPVRLPPRARVNDDMCSAATPALALCAAALRAKACRSDTSEEEK